MASTLVYAFLCNVTIFYRNFAHFHLSKAPFQRLKFRFRGWKETMTKFVRICTIWMTTKLTKMTICTWFRPNRIEWRFYLRWTMDLTIKSMLIFIQFNFSENFFFLSRHFHSIYMSSHYHIYLINKLKNEFDILANDKSFLRLPKIFPYTT